MNRKKGIWTGGNWKLGAGCLGALLLLSSAAACIPRTTRSVPARQLSPSSDKTTLVFLRPLRWGVDGSHKKVPWVFRGSYVRIIDASGRVVADLRFNQYAVVQVEPGLHTFFAYNWASGKKGRARCVGALRASVAAARVYPVLVQEFWGGEVVERGDRGVVLARHRIHGHGSCRRMELLRVWPAEQPKFWQWMRGTERREILPHRERSVFVDGLWILESILELGRRRLTGAASWSCVSSTIRPADGVRNVPKGHVPASRR